jgi:hypothetical protein
MWKAEVGHETKLQQQHQTAAQSQKPADDDDWDTGDVVCLTLNCGGIILS